MTMTEWAEREVELACKRERKNGSDDWCDYGCACYESALKAYKSLMEDDHSGASFGLTASILRRLMNSQPLTPIEDVDDTWDLRSYRGDDEEIYQCKRMSSLFKHVFQDSSIKYSDIGRVTCIDINNNNIAYHSGLVTNIIDEMYPITMPYSPTKAIKVYCEDFLTDPANGDFDTRGVFYAVWSDGERVEIDRYFKDKDDGWDEIDRAEYMDRKDKRVVR